VTIEINGQKYYKTSEACKKAGISRATLFRWLKEGILDKYRKDRRGWRIFTEEDLEKIRELGLPFWLAGSYGGPGKLDEALRLGATGIQVGTAFAFCEESGITPEIKQQVFQLSREGKLHVFTDPLASPTGFPFKVVQLPGTLSDTEFVARRKRLCDLGYLRHAYRKADGTIGYRCPAEPVEDYLRKGGALEDTKGRECVCNSLVATIGLPQPTPGNLFDLPLVTAGNEVVNIAHFLQPGRDSYTAAEVVQLLLK